MNTPIYTYSKSKIIFNINTLKNITKGFSLLYSVKANPFAPILKIMAKEKIGSDAASLKEVELSIENGIKKENIYFSTPGKTKEEIEKAINKSIIICDSLNELGLCNNIAKSHNTLLKVGIRINPDFSESSKFGIDSEKIKKLMEYPFLNIVGIQVHLKSQITDTKMLSEYYNKVYNLAKNLKKPLEFINFGGGMGIVYSDEQPLDFKAISKTLLNIAKDNQRNLKARLIIESGRFLVCTAGIFYTKIVDIKVSKEKKYLIVENGLNGFFRPALANIINSNEGKEPLFTSKDEIRLSINNNNKTKEKVSVVGRLCTSCDVMKTDVILNKASIGDIIAVSNAGSYSYSLSPLFFSSHKLPKQALIK